MFQIEISLKRNQSHSRIFIQQYSVSEILYKL